MDITSGLCSGFDDKLSGAMGSLDQLKYVIGSPTSLLRGELSKLNGATASSAYDIDYGMNTISNAATNSIPSIPNVSDIEGILQDCNLLQGSILGGLQSPAAIVGGYLNQVTDAIGDAIYDTLSALGNLLEAPAAFIINQINNLLKGFGIGSILSELDGLINCLDSICGTDVSWQIDTVNNLLNDLNLDEQGNFDINQAVDGMDIPYDVIENVSNIASTLGEETTKAEEALAFVGGSMSEGIDKIIDANIDSEEVITVAEAEIKYSATEATKLKSFFA